ncbi:efflux RND transporter periplasmic adaptor subunit [Taibaiella chishuiensis]|uniref:Membrane fusion protein (Multidrug efflux system) n=1 Tax=Taibaiella chishuiensis TaxID=1434707 RepID=A0A2P8D492_9BACT|nr:efflux RND transporter periplasmic adaptor subunit [Taibaiella chishuiensis]PSK92035.1 membrane fusion protein (multidrug efflux system) [Taibaiella chishuiensis]
MKNRSLIPVYLLATAVAFASCGGNKNAQPPAMPPAAVEVATVNEGAASYHENYPGTVTALNEVELRPQVSGYITGIHFQDGQHVNKGQLLYSIDQQTYQAGVSQAQANLAVSRANLVKAQKDADRYIALDKKDAIAKQVLDHAMADLESAKMQVRAAEAGVKGVETNLRYSNIYAPFSGTIGISLVKMGASVSPGTTLLNTISTDDPIAVDFFLDQKELGKFTELEKQGTVSKDSTFTIALADGSEYPFSGKVASIDRAVDAQTGTIRVRLAFQNAEKNLRPGMSTVVKVYHTAADHSLIIPYKAVTEQMGEYFVYKVTDSSTVTQTKVKMGTVIRDNVVIKDGLAAGDKIVVDGLQKVKEGAKIAPTQPGAAGQPAAGAPAAGKQ